jgi:hypothetical protein
MSRSRPDNEVKSPLTPGLRTARPQLYQAHRLAAAREERNQVTPTTDDRHHARLLWDYLRLGIPVRPADCLLVFGGHDIGLADRAAQLYKLGTASLIVVSGGSRAVPDGRQRLRHRGRRHRRRHPHLRRPQGSHHHRAAGRQHQRELLALGRAPEADSGRRDLEAFSIAKETSPVIPMQPTTILNLGSRQEWRRTCRPCRRRRLRPELGRGRSSRGRPVRARRGAPRRGRHWSPSGRRGGRRRTCPSTRWAA